MSTVPSAGDEQLGEGGGGVVHGVRQVHPRPGPQAAQAALGQAVRNRQLSAEVRMVRMDGGVSRREKIENGAGISQGLDSEELGQAMRIWARK